MSRPILEEELDDPNVVSEQSETETFTVAVIVSCSENGDFFFKKGSGKNIYSYTISKEKSNPHAYKELSSCVGEKVVLTYYLLSQKSNWNKTIAVTAVNK